MFVDAVCDPRCMLSHNPSSLPQEYTVFVVSLRYKNNFRRVASRYEAIWPSENSSKRLDGVTS